MQDIAQARPGVAGDGDLQRDPELLPQHREPLQQVVLAYGDLLIYSSELISQGSNISYQQNSGQRKLTENRKIHFDPFPDTYIS